MTPNCSTCVLSNKEIWKPVVGYEELYKVSNLGRIKRITDNHGNPISRIKAIAIDWKGYKRVQLYKNNKRKFVPIHRIVAMAFIGLPPKGKIINHKNGNKLENNPCNLEWVTYRENNLHSIRILGNNIGSKHGRSKLKESDIGWIRNLINNTNLTLKEIGEEFNVSESNIRKIKNGVTWQHV